MDRQMAFCPLLHFSLTLLLLLKSDYILKPFATQTTSMQFVVTVTLHEYNIIVFPDIRYHGTQKLNVLIVLYFLEEHLKFSKYI